MSTGLHKDLALGERHAPCAYEYADATARAAATGFVAGDLGKFARQLDDNTIWMLTATTPTWQHVGSDVPLSRLIGTTNGLQGGGDLSADRTLSPTYGTAVNTVCQGNDSRLSDARTPTAHATTHKNGGADEVATATPAANAIPKADGSSKLDSWVTADAVAATSSLRKLGTTSTSACAGDDARLSDARTPTSHASTHNAGGGDALTIDAAAGTGSLRTLGTAATAACAGNDSRLSNARTPTSHASTHNAGGADALAIDSAAGTGSLRTLGTAATAACAGNDARLSDGRTDANAIHKNVSAEISTVTEKVTPVANDLVLIEDSADTNAKKRVLLGNLPGLITHTVSVASANSNITTTSATFVLTTGMTLTPAAGTYLCFFQGAIYNDNTGAGLYVGVAIHAGGTLDAESELRLSDGVNYPTPFTCVGVVTVNGAQAIEGRWMRSAGTGTAYMRGPRSLQIIKIG